MIAICQKERLKYIDALRGFAIFMVVYSHVVFHTFDMHTTLSEIISTIHMPLFFFISGTVINKWSISSYSEYIHIILNKVVSWLVVPIIIGGVYSWLILDKSFLYYVMDIMKYGYWFTISLFQIYVLFLTTVLIVNKSELYKKEIVLVLLVVVASLLWFSIYLFMDNDLYKFMVKTVCIRQTSLYLPFFCFGVYIQLKLNKILSINVSTIIGLIVCFVCCTILNLYYSDQLNIMFPIIPVKGILLLLIGFCGCLILYLLFRRFIDSNKWVNRFLIRLGTNTLSIYLIHYFLLHYFSCFKDTLIGDNSLLNFFVCFLLSLVMMTMCICIKYSIKRIGEIFHVQKLI